MSEKKIRQNKVDVVFDFIELEGKVLEKKFGLSPSCRGRYNRAKKSKKLYDYC